MKVNHFITIYNARLKQNKDISREDIIHTIKDLIKPSAYISYDNKLKIIEATLDATSESAHPTADRYRYFVMNLISAYTSLEVDIDGFDALCETQLIDIVLSTFEAEYAICSNLMQMCLQDGLGG